MAKNGPFFYCSNTGGDKDKFSGLIYDYNCLGVITLPACAGIVISSKDVTKNKKTWRLSRLSSFSFVSLSKSNFRRFPKGKDQLLRRRSFCFCWDGEIQKAKKTTAFSSLDLLFSPYLRKQVTFHNPEITPPLAG